MTGAEHYTEAERLLTHAQGVLDDDSMDAGPRDDYADEDEYFAAIEMSEQASVSAEQTATVYGQLAQVHATLALAAATALNDSNGGAPVVDYRAWKAVASAENS